MARGDGQARRQLADMKSDYRKKYGFYDSDNKPVLKTRRGLDEGVVRRISAIKGEPEWMLRFRLQGLGMFRRRAMPDWGADLSEIDFRKIIYYSRPQEGRERRRWSDVPAGIKRTFERLGVPEAERRFLGGAGAQYDSEMVYHHLRRDLEKRGIVFLDMDSAVREQPELVRKYMGTVVPTRDNKFSALNSAVWSGGSFIYVPKGVRVPIPLQAYFRINGKNLGQFERTLIIADEGSSVYYIEGCTAPMYSSDSLHAAVVELIALPGSKIRYTTIQNWSTNVYNLVTKRALAHEGASIEWIDGNIGSKKTMKYPSVILAGRKARADILSIAFAGKGQHQDTGSKVLHLAPDTTSTVVSKSISKDGGRATYRGRLFVSKEAKGARSSVRCNALILDERSRADTYPTIETRDDKATISHEATVGKIGEEEIFYLMSRGISRQDAISMIVMGFVEPFRKELPMEYAVELNRLIGLEMGGSLG